MRLINSDTMQLEEFFGRAVPQYYILSHTWGDDEVSFQDYTWIRNHEAEVAEGILDEMTPRQRERVTRRYDSLRETKGYRKIEGFAALVRESWTTSVDPYVPHYLWVDTCCINKESSAELSEAINSMYRWYKGAELCAVYLSDVESTAVDDSFGGSRWFTRGWTLQELLAPGELTFYNKFWEYITNRRDSQAGIAGITGIDPASLDWVVNPEAKPPSVAQRMSWAARRQTSRVEDRAYSLLGLFGVNMPLLYGEGKRAFVRLQEEIIRTTDDQTIFCWGYNQPLKPGNDSGYYGMLAHSPEQYAECGGIEAFSNSIYQFPYQLTNVGLQITVGLVRLGVHGPTYAVLRSTIAGRALGFAVSAFRGPLADIRDGSRVLRTAGHPIPLYVFLNGLPPGAVWKQVVIIQVADDAPLGFASVSIDDEEDVLEAWPHACLIKQPLGRGVVVHFDNPHGWYAFLRGRSHTGDWVMAFRPGQAVFFPITMPWKKFIAPPGLANGESPAESLAEQFFRTPRILYGEEWTGRVRTG